MRKITDDYHWLPIIDAGIMVSNKSAIGLWVEVYYDDDKFQVDQIMAGTGYASQSSTKLHFGLGMADAVDSLVLKWSGSGIEEVYRNLSVNQSYKFVEGEGDPLVEVITSIDQSVNPRRQFQVYPNPASDIVTVQLDYFNEAISIELRDNMGRAVFQSELGGNLKQIDISDLPKGTYHFYIQYPKTFASLRFIKI